VPSGDLKNTIPRITTKEKDFTDYVSETLFGTSFGLVGPATKGPTNKVVEVRTPNEFLRLFGKPVKKSYATMAALLYLEAGNRLSFARIGVEDKMKYAEKKVVDESDSDALRFYGESKGSWANGVKVNIRLVHKDNEDIGDAAEAEVGDMTIKYRVAGEHGNDGSVEVDDSLDAVRDLDVAYDEDAKKLTVELATKDDDGTVVLDDSKNTVSRVARAIELTGEFDVAYDDGDADNVIDDTLADTYEFSGGSGYRYEQDLFRLEFLDSEGDLLQAYGIVSLNDDDNNYVVSELDGSDYLRVEDLLDGQGLSEGTFLKEGVYELSGGDDGDDALDYGHFEDALELFKPRDIISARMLAAPDNQHTRVVEKLISVAEHRKVTVALIDPPEGMSKRHVVRWHNGLLQGSVYPEQKIDSSYAGIYWPEVEVDVPYLEDPVWMPPSGIVAALRSEAAEARNPWDAVAGIRRGVHHRIRDVRKHLDEDDQYDLYAEGNRINPIIKVQNIGVMINGNRTAQTYPTSLDRMNVRDAMIEIALGMIEAGRMVKFEPNDPHTWNEFRGYAKPILRRVVDGRGLYWFDIKIKPTEEDIQAGRLPIEVHVSPTRVAEQIDITFILTDKGVSEVLEEAS